MWKASVLCSLLCIACTATPTFAVSFSRVANVTRVAHATLTELHPEPSAEDLGPLRDVRCRRVSVGDNGAGVTCEVDNMEFSTGVFPRPMVEGRGRERGDATLLLSVDGRRLGRISIREQTNGPMAVTVMDAAGNRRADPTAATDDGAVRIAPETLGTLHRAGFECSIDLGWFTAGAPTARVPGVPNGVWSHRLRCSRNGWSGAVLSTTKEWGETHAERQRGAHLSVWRGQDPLHHDGALILDVTPESPE